jgi:glutathione S-transferase
MSYKLTYFNAGGRADQIRALFIYTGTKYEDERISNEEFLKRKENGDLPFGSLPVLQHGDYKISQGVAINQYVSQKLGLWPKDLEESNYSLFISLAAEGNIINFIQILNK